jgi:hypothetical protein
MAHVDYSCADHRRHCVVVIVVAVVQTAVMRKEGRLQVSGPNINIPKKQLRAQWPAILEHLAPQDVTAHIFVDSADSYIACAAKIILTKAKVCFNECVGTGRRLQASKSR